MKNGVVIIGAGHAGVQAAASLREEGFDGKVTLIGDEAELPYHKPPLSKTFIKDAAAKPQILRAEAFYSGASIDLVLGDSVEILDPAGKRLKLAGGGQLFFDHAILATGSRPRELPAEGAQLGGVLSLRSVADARAIRELAGEVEDVVILGGGFIGLEIAATLAAGGRRVTVVEAQDRLLARVVAPAISAHVTERLAASGVRILMRTTIARLEGDNGQIAAVVTSAGERIAAKMLIIGIGVVPNAELAAAAGLETANGVRVDGQLRSSAPHVLAIGDSANYRHWFTGTDVRLESVQNATDHAKLAARTIIGHTETYTGVPWFWSDIGDMKLQMVGLTGGSDRTIVSGEPADNKFSVFHYAGERLIGIESVNRAGDHMLGRKMMGAGFLPDADLVAGGGDALKAAFAAWQQSQPGLPA
jgi:3-phenylpropionate/trans-cinnamate dioxygenase ferredoxin reductase subunit